VPFGIDIKGKSPASSPRIIELRRLYGSRVVLFVGRLIYYKGLEVLIEAMKEVQGKLLVIGDGPLRESLADQVRSMRLENRVVLVGRVPQKDIPNYYAAADVFAFPSIARSEAFGVAQLEAMFAGLPVVNTMLDSGVPEVSVHGETGLSVPVANAPALALALKTLLDDSDLRRRYGQAGRERVLRYFDADAMASRVDELYAASRGAARSRVA